MTSFKPAGRVIGIDVAKDKLDVHDAERKITKEVKNTKQSIQKHIVDKITDPTGTLVVCEATGDYERTLVKTLQQAGIPVCVANPLQVRQFGKGLGTREKTDPIDAALLCRFGQVVELIPTPPKSPEHERHEAMVRRREQLLDLVSQEENRLQHSDDKSIIAMHTAVLKLVKKQLKTVDEKLAEFLKSEAETNPAVNIMQSVPGVGVVTTATLIADLPELGTLNRKEIAKLVGVAPIANQSGLRDKRRSVFGGRSHVRRVLYMSALTATAHNPAIRTFYRRLVVSGKPKKVAIVACMRKLLTTLNRLVHTGQIWRNSMPEKEQVVTGT